MKEKDQQSAVEFPGNSRVHIAVATTDLESSREFYQTLLGVSPTKERDGYVKFEPEDPSVNLTLNEVSSHGSRDNGPAHFGIQVKSTEAVTRAAQRLEAVGKLDLVEEGTACCYAVQDKVWAVDPDGNRWEVFVVLDPDSDVYHTEESECCESETNEEKCCETEVAQCC